VRLAAALNGLKVFTV